MTTSFLGSKELRARFSVIRRVLPFAVFGAVLVYQAISVFFLRESSAVIHYLADLIAYGIIGPLAAWLAFDWITQQIEERERALAAKARAEAEQQRAEEAAREQERLLAAVCANSADAIIGLDNQGHITAWNRGAEMMFGYAGEDVLGKHFKMIVPPEIEARGEMEWLSEQMREAGFVRNYETERIAKDGRRVIVDLTRTAVQNARGEIVGSSAILRDITERVRTEHAIQQLNLELETKVAERTSQLGAATEELRRRNSELERANQELQQLDELKSDFVSMVSHELRAPLTNINGSIELLLDGDSGCMQPEHREMLQIVSEQSQRLTRLVQGILNVSRIEAGQLVLQPQAFNMLSLIERVIGVWESRGVSNRFERPRGMNLPSVWADRDRTEEILFNLIDNGIKYSPDAATIRVDAEANGQQVIVSVSDKGIGIPDEELPKIFDKFHRVDRRDASESYGHGLGLYICRRLVEAQGGRIWVDSVLGEGSTFRFSLPMAGRGEAERTGSGRRQTVGGRR
ncbi:MAG: PAS domain S-box protein [Chloroflexi bacterium]|nr:PAS domain S-box protein [Chloroflexota bacterium]